MNTTWPRCNNINKYAITVTNSLDIQTMKILSILVLFWIMVTSWSTNAYVSVIECTNNIWYIKFFEKSFFCTFCMFKTKAFG